MDPQVLVVSLVAAPPSLIALRALFPAAQLWPATDLRRKRPSDLLEEGLIDILTEDVLEHGRKHHWEMCSTGAVGLAASTRAALSSGPGPLLLCEEDCVPRRELAAQVRALLASGDPFDAAVFGPRHRHAVAGYGVGALPQTLLEGVQYAPSSGPEGWARPLSHFEGTHCVLYSFAGRRRVAELLQPPLRMQTDALLSMHALRGTLRVLVQAGPAGAVQTSTLVASTIQVPCLACILPSGGFVFSALASLLVLAFVFLLVTVRVVRRDA